jgi:hypothetical protein
MPCPSSATQEPLRCTAVASAPHLGVRRLAAYCNATRASPRTGHPQLRLQSLRAFHSRYTRRMSNPRIVPQRRIGYVSALIAATAFTSVAAGKHTPPLPLESFYVVTQATFHKAPKWVDHILEVRPQGDAVLVREIRIAPLDPACPHHVTVRAVERLLSDTTVKKLAIKFPLCSFEEDVVEGMINTAKRPTGAVTDADDSASQTIVARCGTQQKMFERPDEESLRFDAIHLADAHLAAFWELAATMEAHTFGSDFSLAKLTPQEDQDAQVLGAKIVPEIKSGRYDQGFADQSCPYAECPDHNANSALQGYQGPIFACPPK